MPQGGSHADLMPQTYFIPGWWWLSRGRWEHFPARVISRTNAQTLSGSACGGSRQFFVGGFMKVGPIYTLVGLKAKSEFQCEYRKRWNRKLNILICHEIIALMFFFHTQHQKRETQAMTILLTAPNPRPSAAPANLAHHASCFLHKMRERESDVSELSHWSQGSDNLQFISYQLENLMNEGCFTPELRWV